MPSPSPAPIRQHVRTFPTPLVGDLLFYDHVSTDNKEHPEYETPHPDQAKWPDHVLVFITPVPDAERANLFRYYYAANRENQDTYNYEFSQADIGGTKFNTVVRTYVYRRDEEFDPLTPLMGTPMPNVPEGLFEAAATGETLSAYPMAERVEVRHNDEILTSAFVIEKRTYVKRVVISQINDDPSLGVGFRKTTTLYYRGETGMAGVGVAIEDLFADGSLSFWGLQSDGSINVGQMLSENWFAVITTGSRDAAFLAYKQVVPSSVDLRLPDVLASAPTVVWNKANGTGAFASDWEGLSASDPGIQNSLSGSESARANAAASIQPELSLNIVQSDGRDIPSISAFFYMKLTAGVIDEAALIARILTVTGIAATRWPTFHPVAHVITLRGQKVSVSAQASASASMSASDTGSVNIFSYDKNEGSGTDKDFSTMNGTTRIPPTLHAELTITSATDTATAQATCDVGWTGTGTADIVVDGVSYPVDFPSTTAAADTGAISATGVVSPTVLAATDPPAIPSGDVWYFLTPKLDPVDSVWQRVYVELFNASNI